MSRFDSPLPSVTSSRAHSPSPASPRRPSLESNLNASTTGLAVRSETPPAAGTRGASPSHRRNRAALRDYYNLKAGRSAALPSPSGTGARSPTSAPATATSTEFPISPSPESGFGVGSINDLLATESGPIPAGLDSSDFDAQRYIDELLATSSLATVLKAENTLVGDIRTLDGERKALVYDNYAKLIRAVDTIGTMRTSMEERGAPLTMTKTLGPAVSFVAETAAGLIHEGEEQKRKVQEAKSATIDDKTAERETVTWALGTPARLRGLLKEQKRSEAEQDWAEINGLLDNWAGVSGVAELRAACEEVMKQDDET
jgi:vacuolar protein sorting-associated protein 51